MGLEIFEKYEVVEKEKLIKIEGEVEFDLTKVKDIEERTYEFGDEENKRKVTRYIYTFEDGKKYLVPKSAHNDIVFLVKKKNVKRVQIMVRGAGKYKEYVVFAIADNPTPSTHPSETIRNAFLRESKEMKKE